MTPLRLAFESHQTFRVERECRRQDLQRHIAIQRDIARAIHFAHPAGAKQRDNFVGPNERTVRKSHVEVRREL